MKKHKNPLSSLSNLSREDQDLTAENVRAEIHRVVQDIIKSQLQLSRLLTLVHDHQWYRVWNYDTFREFLDAELTISFKTAQALVSIEHYAINKGGITREDIHEIGFARALLLVPLARAGRIHAGNRKDIVKQASTKTVVELKAYLHNLLPTEKSQHTRMPSGEMDAMNGESERSPSSQAHTHVQDAVEVAVSTGDHEIPDSCTTGNKNGSDWPGFTLTDEQAVVVKRALEVAMGVMGVLSPEVLLVAICEEYSRAHDSAKSSAEPVQDGGHTRDRSRQGPDRAQEALLAMDPNILLGPLLNAAVAPLGPDDLAVDWSKKPRRKRVEANTAPSTAPPMEKTTRRRKSPDLPDAK